jgi:F420-non-reducing hydrogenase large subunit
MTSLVFPLSRIEGHARVIIEIEDGQVLSAHFQAMEMRGFQYFVQSIPAEQMPVIVPRICGVCSTAQHVAAVKALEDAYGVTPPPLAQKIRELLLLGQLIQNQATSLFFFTMPDRLGTTSLFPIETEEPTTESEKTRNHIAMQALMVRKAGTDLITAAGGQFIHPIKAVVGGVTSGITTGESTAICEQLLRALPVACELFDSYCEMSIALHDRIGTWGDDSPTCYITCADESFPEYNGDLLRIMGAQGEILDAFPPRLFRSYLNFQESDYSYAGQTDYHGEILRANSLARINMTRCMGTPRADEYLARFQKAFGHPAHAILLFDLCRGIELVYAIERAATILEQPLDQGDTAVSHTPRDGDGYGLVEAPRGPLVHHYKIERGLITSAEFIIPTVHNVRAIERALEVAARRYINPERVSLELERAVGRVVRAFDPCISCATH